MLTVREHSGVRVRVLLILPNFGFGGAERMVADLACGLDQKRFEVAVVSLFEPAGTEMELELDRSHVPVLYLGKHRGFDVRMYGRLGRAVREFRPYIIHTHRYVLRYLLPIPLYRRIPVRIHTVHSVAEREVDTVGKWTHHLAFRQGVLPVSIARAVSTSLEKLYGIAGPPLIPNGIRVALYANPRVSRVDWRRDVGFRDDEILLVSVGRLSPEKNHSLLLRAFSSYSASAHQCHLIVVGDGPLRGDLEAEAKSLGLVGKVRFLGLRTDVPDILAAADMFVLSSDWEGNPLSVMEAMAAGKPVIATAVGGVPELIEDDETGLLVPPRNVKALETALIELLTCPERRKSMGAAAAKVARDRFDVSGMVRAYEQLYEGLLRTRIKHRAQGRLSGLEDPWAVGGNE